MKLFFYFSILIFSIKIGACTLELSDKIIISSIDTITYWPLPSKDCSPIILQQLTKSFSSFDGEISTQMLSNVLTQEFNSPIHIDPSLKTIEIIQLKNIIKKSFSQTTHEITKASFIHSSPVISLSVTDEINLSCSPCEFNHTEQINLIIKRGVSSNQNILISAQFEKMIEAYEVTKPIFAFQDNIPLHSLRKKMIPQKNFLEVFTATDVLAFYRTNKMLKVGDILTKSDLTPIPLVKAGEKTEMTFNSQGISLKAFGIARQHGGFNELIEVINPLNQKKFLGKVTDYKKIMVDL